MEKPKRNHHRRRLEDMEGLATHSQGTQSKWMLPTCQTEWFRGVFPGWKPANRQLSGDISRSKVLGASHAERLLEELSRFIRSGRQMPHGVSSSTMKQRTDNKELRFKKVLVMCHRFHFQKPVCSVSSLDLQFWRLRRRWLLLRGRHTYPVMRSARFKTGPPEHLAVELTGE